MKAVFDRIYEHQLWSAAGDGSGTGSEPAYNVHMRALLTRFVHTQRITSICDAPCGACKWAAVWLSELGRSGAPLTSYHGIDIAHAALRTAGATLQGYARTSTRGAIRTSLASGDIRTCALPLGVDMVLCRDTLQHLSITHIRRCLRNLARHRSVRWYVLGGYRRPRDRGTRDNVDIPDGHYFEFDPSRAPFRLRATHVYSERNDVRHPQKHLFVYEGAAFRAQVGRL